MVPNFYAYEDVSDSHNLSRSLLEHGPAIALIDEDSIIIYKNAAANQLFGEELDNGLGTNALAQIHTDDRQQAEELLTHLLHSPNSSGSIDVRYRLRDESYRWLGATCVNLLGDPNVNAIAVYYRDISERKQAEEQRLLLQSALNAAASGVVITDSEGSIEWANPAFTQLTGYDAADVIGQNPRFLKSGVHNRSFYRNLWDTVLSGNTWTDQLVNKRADGSLYNEAMTVTPVRNGDNRVEHFIAIKQDVTQQQRAEQALRESENRYRTLFENSATSLWEMDLSGLKAYIDSLRDDGISDFEAYVDANPETLIGSAELVKMVDVNQATVQLIEAGSKEELLTGLATVFTPETFRVFRRLLHGLINGESRIECETVQQTMTGKPIWLSLQLALVTGYEDTWGKVSVAATDVSALRQAVREAKDKNRELTFLNHIVALSSSALNVDEMLTNMCREVKQYMSFGHVAAYLLDDERAMATVMAEAKAPECPSVLGATLPVQTTDIFDQLTDSHEPLVVQSGKAVLGLELCPVKESVGTDSMAICLPLQGRDELRGVVCCMGEGPLPHERDMRLLASVAQTTSKSVENGLLYSQVAEYNKSLKSTVDQRTKQLRQTNRQLEAILNNAHDSILLLDSSMVIESANLAFNRQFGYSQEAAANLSLTALAAPESVDALSSAMTSTCNSSGTHSLQITGKRRDGSTFDAEALFIALPDDDKQVVCTIHDISHLKSIERMKDKFISSVNHELRNPIAGIILSADGLRRHYDRMDDAMKLEQVDHIRAQSRILSDLTDSILNISRVEARANKPSTDEVDMCAVAHNVITEMGVQIEHKRHHLKIMCDSSVPHVRGDAMDYAQIWRNLISNAIKYTQDEGEITVRLGVLNRDADSTSETGGSIQVDMLPDSLLQSPNSYLVGQVEDTGHGISEDDLEHLFIRFWRGWAHHNSIPGSGLGLPLVKEILDVYDGSIAVESTLGMGGVFTFWLPLAEDLEQ